MNLPIHDDARDHWKAWCEFCDLAMVAPDTTRTPEDLAERYFVETGIWVTAAEVAALMPEARDVLMEDDER